jgi:hypothetical protein
MDFASPLEHKLQPTPSGLQMEATDAAYKQPTVLERLKKDLAGLGELAVPTVGLAVGVVARAPGEVGLVGKIAAIGLGGVAAGESLVRSLGPSRESNTGVYIRDGAFFAGLGAGLTMGPRFFTQEAAPEARNLSTSLAEDLTRQNEVLNPALSLKPVAGLGEDVSGAAADKTVVRQAVTAEEEARLLKGPSTDK